MSRNLALIVALTTACGVGDHGSARQHLGGGDGGIGLPDAPVDAFVPEDTLVEPPDAEVDAFVPEDSGTFGEPDIYLTEPLSGSLEFGDINVGQNSSSQTVAVSNFGTADLSISQVSIFGTGASSFAITSGQVPPPTFVVAPGAQTSWQLRCTPATVGAKSATLRIVSNDPDQPNTDVSLSCNGVQSSLLVTPSPVAFGTHRVGAAPATIEVTLENTGGASLTVNSASMSGAPELSLASAANLPMVLSAGGSTTVTLAFAPTASAAFAATLSVQSSDPSSPTNVAVSGTGEEPMIEVTPADPVEVGAACIGADTDIPFT
ncbi:MAG TPA: choice-of-anchor D domain-containing protein, partial [Kofleriaceae bacterium]|nr:choice-of-anchor D domain-containing protein [Kofleriaceae bacterium]